MYADGAVDRVVRIQELFAAGLSSTVIRELLPCIHDEDGSPNETATPWLSATLRAERSRIEDGIRDLVRAREVLDGVIDSAGPGDRRGHTAPAKDRMHGTQAS